MSGVQLRLGFDEPSRPVTLFLRASGLRVLVEVSHGATNDAHAYLTTAGVQPEMSTASGLTFPLPQFTRLRSLPEQATALADHTLRPLLEWVENPPDDGLAAELELGADRTMWLGWISNGTRFSEPLSVESATAVLSADLPFVASPAALETLRSACHLPILVGRCRTHRSGYVEVVTAKPQLLEACAIPGLFRLDDTTYGLPFASLASLAAHPGFVWEGPVPQLEAGPRQLPPMPARLSSHVTTDLRELVDALAAYRTQLVAWDSGLGRRVFVLAALVALDAFPALVVTTPDNVWQWWRHAALFSRSRGVDDDEVDVRVITYRDFVANPTLAYSAQTLIFDDVASSAADSPEVAAAAIGIGGMLDCYLVGIADELPDDPKQLVGVMSRLRPAEFSATTPLMDRYGTDTRAGLLRHAAAYVSRRTGADPGQDQALRGFNHTQVHAVEVSRELRVDLDGLSLRGLNEQQYRNAAREMVSAGSPYTLSPKVAVAVDMAAQAVESGRRVAVVTAFRRTSSLLAGLLRSNGPEVLRPGTPAVPRSRLVLVEGMEALPDLSWFDEVVVVDYPDSYAILDAAVGHPAAEYAPSVVTLLHAVDTIDDDLCVEAARNEERAAGSAGDSEPDDAAAAAQPGPLRLPPPVH